MRDLGPPTFEKYSGAGNTFLIVFDEANFQKKSNELLLSRASLMKLACSAQGLCADGGFVLRQKYENLWAWDFYNSDGSAAEMCGNAARCALTAIHQRGPSVNKILLETRAGVIHGQILPDGRCQVEMMEVDWFKTDFVVEGVCFDWLDTGVPHAVFQGNPMTKQKSRSLRKHLLFGPRGANITNYVPLGADRIRATSYERGVEDFTLACGTGAVAAALTFARRSSLNQEKILVEMPGGDIEVEVGLARPRMIGRALKVAQAEISLEALRDQCARYDNTTGGPSHE